MVVSARNRELFGLLPVALLVTAGFAAVLNAEGAHVHDATVTYGVIFLGLCLVAHVFIRARLPYADPYLFPLAALLAAIGIVTIYRIKPELARDQAQWFVLGLVVFCFTVVFLRDIDRLRQYRFTIAVAAIVLLLLPRLTGGATNGAYLQVHIGPLGFQPAELAKLAIVVFLAAYLADTRRMLVTYERRFLGVAIPPLRYFGPMLTVWIFAMLLLVFIRDLGTSVMFFGGFLALLYVATERVSYVVIGLAMFLLGFAFFAHVVSHVGDRVDTWQHPFDPHLYYAQVGGSFQVVQSMFAQADGGLLGVGLGRSFVKGVLPAAQTDLIYSVIVNDLGLAGAAGLLLAYLLFVFRGLKTATIARDPFAKLLAAGLSVVFALQVFVIVGGVTRAIPLTGVTLPWVSYGGSSIVANFILLALLMIVSNQARRPHGIGSGGVVR